MSAATDPNPGAIMALSTAFWDAQVLLTANRIGVFEALAGGPLTVEAVAQRLEIADRPARLLLNACVGLELLEKAGDRYANAPAAHAFLVPGSPAFLGNAIRYSDNLYATWGQLENALRNDAPQLATESYTGGEEAITRDFVYGMHDRALGIGRVLVELVDLTGCRRLLDVGGGPGTYAALFAARYPGLKGTVLDLPGVVAHTREILAAMQSGDEIDTLPGSFKDTDFPGGNDAVLISGVFHRESVSGCRSLIERAAGSLASGGMLIISDVFTDADGTSPAFATLFGLNMMLTAPKGGVHADAQVAAWLSEAGFEQVTAVPFPPPMPHRVVTGVKP